MKTIAFYISDYGYGHATRSIAVIRKLLAEPNVRIIICHSHALNFIRKSLNTNRVKYRSIITDIGYFLLKESINPDKKRLQVKLKEFFKNWDCKIMLEKKFLMENQVDLVVSDISALPFEATKSLGIPSVGMSNFTWHTAYHELVSEDELRNFKQAYQKMDYYFSLAGSNEHWGGTVTQYGFFSREVSEQEVKKIRYHLLPNENNKVVFFGLGMKIGLESIESLPIWSSPGCVFIVSSNVKVNRPNVYRISDHYLESQHFIAASDLVISKAGWGMVGEAITANVPLLILNRPTMKEDQNTINYLTQRNLCNTLEWEDFKSLHFNAKFVNDFANVKQNRPRNNSREAERISRELISIIK